MSRIVRICQGNRCLDIRQGILIALDCERAVCPVQIDDGLIGCEPESLGVVADRLDTSNVCPPHEEKCRALITAWRWPDGFRCPRCNGSAHCIVSERRLFQCNACHHQASPTAGTIFDATKALPTVWFRAIYLIPQTKQCLSSIEIGRRLGTTQTTAWKIKTKLAEVMQISGAAVRLEGRVEMDDAYLGGQQSGRKAGRTLANIRSLAPTEPSARSTWCALAEFKWRFNHRDNLAAMISVLACAV